MNRKVKVAPSVAKRENMAEEAVTQQPKSKRAQIIKLVSDMDPSLVLGKYAPTPSLYS